MKYFLDTEFIEGPQSPKWLILKSRFGRLMIGKPKPTIDLISIGIVAEDGREYYAISKDFNLNEAWNRYDLVQQSGDMRNIFPEGKKVYWLRENVLKPIWRDLFFQADDCSGLSNKQTEAFYQGVITGEYDNYFTFKSFKLLIAKYGKSNKQIAEEIKLFCSYKTKIEGGENTLYRNKDEAIEFYAYYADYDWVVFCWLFGKMMDLPNGFPMYCKDLKQEMDRKVRNAGNCIDEKSFNYHLEYCKNLANFPKQDPSKSHNAIEDARWNKKLYEFLNKL